MILPNLKKWKESAAVGCALACAAATPGAVAAIAVQATIFDPPAELFLAVYDPVQGVTYTRDLGVFAQGSILNNNDYSFAPDALYQTTFSDSNPADLRYAVTAVFDFDASMYLAVFTTSNSPSISLPAPADIALPAIFSAVSDYVEAVNLAAGSTDVADDLSVVISDSSSDGFYTNPATFNENLGSIVLFNTGAPVGEALAFHELGIKFLKPNLFQRTFDKEWLLAADGTLTFTTAGSVDTDGDGVSDLTDNCLAVPNADQDDGDADGFGNVCDTDLSNDCITNVVDLGLLRTVFFSDDAAADFNSDGVVNVADLGVMRATFLRPPGPSAVASCP